MNAYIKRKKCAAAVLSLCLLYKYYKAKYEKKRKEWVRKMHRDRAINGFFEKNVERMKRDDEEQFLKCTRMSVETFNCIFNLLKDKLTKTSIRRPISAECRLFLTLL